MQTITPTQAGPIVQAIIEFFSNDADRVSEFYLTAFPRLQGTHPLTDAVLEALAEWLAGEHKRDGQPANRVMTDDHTREPQYQIIIDLRSQKGLTALGPMMNQVWHDDPRRLLFVLSRYKFVSRMLSGKQRALEVGCGDAFGTRIVLQEVPYICAIDFDPFFVNDVNARMEERWKFDCKVHDMLSGPLEGEFDAAYSLDVIEHIPKADEHRFVSNISRSLTDDGLLIIGTPSIQSQAYASRASKEGHVNCKDQKELKALLSTYFDNIFSFSMNDEVVHTGFYPMAHYLFAVCTGKKRPE